MRIETWPLGLFTATQNKCTCIGVIGTKARLEWIVMRIIINTKQVSGTQCVLNIWQVLLRNYNLVADFVGCL